MSLPLPALILRTFVLLVLLTGLPAAAAEKEHRFFRFVPTKLRDSPGAPNSVQVSEMEFRLRGEAVDMGSATVTNPGGNNPPGEGPANLTDGTTQSKWLDLNKGAVVFEFPAPVAIDSYRFATANDFAERDPANWRLDGSDDGLSWAILDEAVNRAVPTERHTFTETLQLSASVPPYASFWHPGHLLRWTPESDPDSAFNRSGVPLAGRLAKPALKVNPNARSGEGRVAVLTTFGNTSYNPAQGSANAHFNAYTGWQYTDKLVFWGGSAGEGLILAPTAPVIDAAHRNGVPVLGTVFFPPTVYGGQFHWVREFLQQSGASFPVADKLIEVARHHGFDGWFINQETAGGNAGDAEAMRDFMIYFRAQAPELEIMWYDAMTEGGNISWQNALTSSNDIFVKDGGNAVAHSMFLNFWWNAGGLSDSRSRALSLGMDPYDVYAGIDVESAGSGTSANWDAIFPPGQTHRLSVAFYGAQSVFRNSGNPAAFQSNEIRFWSGANGDPSDTATDSSWKGLAHYVPATTPIDGAPFVTNFNRGQGNRYVIDGDTVSVADWNNLSVQDVLPTWRWIVQSNGSKLQPSLDLDDAYYGGTSLKIAGTLDSVNEIKLFATDIPVTDNTRLQIVYKTGVARMPTRMQVAIAFNDSPEEFIYFDVGSARSNGWNPGEFDLGAHAGKKIAIIGLRFASPSAVGGYQIRIGRLAVLDGPESVPAPASDLRVIQQDSIDADSLSVRLAWERSATAGIYYYNIFQRMPDNSRRWLGATPNNAFHIPSLRRQGLESDLEIEIEAVGSDFGASPPVSLAVTLPPGPDTNYQFVGSIIGTPGSWSNVGNTREKVFDGDLTTAFDAPETEGGWVGLDFGAGNQRRITAIRFAPRPNFAGRMVGGVFQGANQANFSDAVTLYTVTSTPPELVFTTVGVNDPALFRYFRYAAGGHCNVAEIEVYGYGPPGVPVGLAAHRDGGVISLTWNEATWTESYRIERGGSPGGPFTVVGNELDSPSFTDTGLAHGDRYFYRARTVNPVGVSAWSQVLEVPPRIDYAAWREAAFGAAADDVAGELADPDRDRIPNLIEFALGLSPVVVDATAVTASPDAADPGLVYTRSTTATGVTLSVRWSDDLETWSDSEVAYDVIDIAGDRETIRASVPPGPAGRRFMRLHAVSE